MLRFYPAETVIILTAKREVEIFESFNKVLLQHTDSTTRITRSVGSSNFEIIRKLKNGNNTLIIAHGVVEVDTSTCNQAIYLDVTAKDQKLLLFMILWYVLNLLLFTLFLYSTIIHREFHFLNLLPLMFILLGYGLSTLMMQGAVDELIRDIKKAIK
jgi:hypothetical protein